MRVLINIGRKDLLGMKVFDLAPLSRMAKLILTDELIPRACLAPAQGSGFFWSDEEQI